MNKISLCFWVILLFPITKLLSDYSDLFDSYDELVAVISMIICTKYFIKKQLNSLLNTIYLCFVLLTVIGIISNLYSHLVKEALPVALDIVGLWKTFAPFIMFSYLTRNENTRELLLIRLRPVAVFILYLLFFTSIISQFVDIGASGEAVYGFREFNFFWHNGIQTGLLLMMSMLVIMSFPLTKRNSIKYIILASVPAFLSFSSLVLCWIFVEIYMFVFLKTDNVFKKKYIFFLAIAVVYFTFEDFESYFLTESPRQTLILYGGITANTYFPLGSGFATYGTEMARRYYSQLYIDYGWSGTWAYGEDSAFLNDVFLGGILGQFGWFGFALYGFCIYKLFAYFNTTNLRIMARITCLATIITLIAVMTASGAVKTAMGEFVFCMLGIISGTLFDSNKNLKNS